MKEIMPLIWGRRQAVFCKTEIPRRAAGAIRLTHRVKFEFRRKKIF
jgi:hypothetical protein